MINILFDMKNLVQKYRGLSMSRSLHATMLAFVTLFLLTLPLRRHLVRHRRTHLNFPCPTGHRLYTAIPCLQETNLPILCGRERCFIFLMVHLLT